MQVAQETFISSTMWTDRLGFIAAKTIKIKTIKISKTDIELWEDKKRLEGNCKKNDIKIDIGGYDCIPVLRFD